MQTLKDCLWAEENKKTFPKSYYRIVKSVIDVVGKESFLTIKNNCYELACSKKHDCIGYSSKRKKC